MNIEISYFLLGKSILLQRISSIDLIFIVVNIGLVSSLNCYSCTGSTGCNDPFNSLGSGVATTGSVSTNTFCIVSCHSNFEKERIGFFLIE